MANYLIGAGYALVSVFVGMFLPMASIGPIRNPTNLLFGFIYGLGWFVGGFIASARSRHVESFGSWIWPIIALMLVAYAVGRLLTNYPGKRSVVLLLCVVALLIVLPGNFVATTPLKHIPIYSSIFLAVY